MDRILDFYRLRAEDNLGWYWAKEILISLLIVALFMLLSRVVRYLLVQWVPRFTRVTKTDLDDRILLRITPPVSFLVILIGLHYSVQSLPLPEKAQSVASGIVFVLNVGVFTLIAYRAVHEVLDWYAARIAEKFGDGLDGQLLPLVEKLVTIFLVGTALIIILKHFNYDILSLVTALGIGSLAIGMAAKDTLANMISGFTLMIDRPFRIGDRIKLTTGLWGDVVDIGLRTTKIKTVDNTLLIIPNSELCTTTLINMAFPDYRTKGRIDVGVAYGSDVEMVKRILVETALEVPEVLRDPQPESYFVTFGDSALNMSLFFWVDDYKRVFAATDLINTTITSRFAKHGIEIPFPIRTVRLEKGE